MATAAISEILLARRKAWDFQHGYPVPYQGPDFDSAQNELKTVTVEIQHGGLEVTPGDEESGTSSDEDDDDPD